MPRGNTWILAVAGLTLAAACRPAAPPDPVVPAAPAPARPVLRVVAEPADADLRVGALTAVGHLDASLDPGAVEIVAARRGFAEARLTLDLRAGDVIERTVVLAPLPYPITVDAEPAAEVRILRDGAVVAAGPTPLTVELPAGPAVFEVAAAGLQPERTELFVDAPVARRVFLDLPGQLVDRIGRFPTAHLPKGLQFTPDNTEIWVAALGGRGVRVHAVPRGEVLGEVDLPEAGAVEVLISADGSRVYASQMETARVYEIDRATRQILRTFETGSTFTKVLAFSADGSRLFASNWKGGDVSEIDLATGALVRRLPTVEEPRGLYPTPDGAALYVAGYGRGQLARIDLATGKGSPVFGGGVALRHLVADVDRGRLYASDQGKDVVYVHDLATGATTPLARTDRAPNTIDLDPTGRVLVVSNRGPDGPGGYLTVGSVRGSVLLLDALTGAVLDAIAGGMQCTALDLSADGALLAFSDFRDDQVHLFRMPSYDALAAGGGGRLPQHAADLRELRYPGKLERYE